MGESHELKTFSEEVVSNFQTTSALAPSSRYLVRAMLAPLALERARTVVEFGPGTGVITRALLEALPARATLLAFEINPNFCRYLEANLSDPRLLVVPAGAERVEEELAARRMRTVDAAVSSLGLTLMPGPLRETVLGGLSTHLAPQAMFTQYQYLHGPLAFLQKTNGHLERFSLGGFLARYFPQVTRRVVWRNLPPAFVYTCRR